MQACTDTGEAAARIGAPAHVPQARVEFLGDLDGMTIGTLRDVDSMGPFTILELTCTE